MRHLNRNHKFTWKLSGNRERETENEGDDKQFIQMVQWVAPIQNQRLKWKAIEQQKNKEEEEKTCIARDPSYKINVDLSLPICIISISIRIVLKNSQHQQNCQLFCHFKRFFFVRSIRIE